MRPGNGWSVISLTDGYRRNPQDPSGTRIRPDIIGTESAGGEKIAETRLVHIRVPPAFADPFERPLLERTVERASGPERPMDRVQGSGKLIRMQMEEACRCPDPVELLVEGHVQESERKDIDPQTLRCYPPHPLGRIRRNDLEAHLPECHCVPAGSASRIQYPRARLQKTREAAPFAGHVVEERLLEIGVRAAVVEIGCLRAVHERTSQNKR